MLSESELEQIRCDYERWGDTKAAKHIPALIAHCREVEAERCPSSLMHGLAHQLINRILATDANCDPEHDVDLRLAAIINERDRLRVRLAERDSAADALIDAHRDSQGQY